MTYRRNPPPPSNGSKEHLKFGSSGFCVSKVGGKDERKGEGKGARCHCFADACPVIPAKAGIQFHRSPAGRLGLGRKDGNTGSFHKDGWIPAPASARTCFRGNDGVGCSRRPTEDGVVGMGGKRTSSRAWGVSQLRRIPEAPFHSTLTGCVFDGRKDEEDPTQRHLADR